MIMEMTSVTRVFFGVTIWLAICALFLLAAPLAHAQYENRPYKNRAEAQKYYDDFKSLAAGKNKINQPIRNLQDLLRSQFTKMRQAVNTSETGAESRSKFQFDPRAFNKLKTDFDLAIEFTRTNVRSTRYQDIKGFGNELQRGLDLAKADDWFNRTGLQGTGCTPP